MTSEQVFHSLLPLCKNAVCILSFMNRGSFSLIPKGNKKLKASVTHSLLLPGTLSAKITDEAQSGCISARRIKKGVYLDVDISTV